MSVKTAKIIAETWSDTDYIYRCTGCGASVVGEGPDIPHTKDCILHPDFRKAHKRNHIKGNAAKGVRYERAQEN